MSHALDAPRLTNFSHTDDDGEHGTRVKEEFIKSLDSDSEDDRRSSKKPREGDKVEADFKGRGKWYKGKVTRVRSDDTCDIEFEDGDSEKRVELKRIKVLGGGSRSRSRPPRSVRRTRYGGAAPGSRGISRRPRTAR